MSKGAVFFGKGLRKERQALGLSQVDVGKKAGISGVYVCRIEKGQLRPPHRVAKKLAKAVRFPELMGLFPKCPSCGSKPRRPK